MVWGAVVWHTASARFAVQIVCVTPRLVCAGWALCGHETEERVSRNAKRSTASQAQGACDVADSQCSNSDQRADGITGSRCSAGDTLPASEHALACDDPTASGEQPGVANGPEAPASEVLSRSERQEIGWLCKRLIDHGRLQWLQAQGFDADIVVYVDPRVTGENRLLIGKACQDACGELPCS